MQLHKIAIYVGSVSQNRHYPSVYEHTEAEPDRDDSWLTKEACYYVQNSNINSTCLTAASLPVLHSTTNRLLSDIPGSRACCATCSQNKIPETEKRISSRYLHYQCEYTVRKAGWVRKTKKNVRITAKTRATNDILEVSSQQKTKNALENGLTKMNPSECCSHLCACHYKILASRFRAQRQRCWRTSYRDPIH